MPIRITKINRITVGVGVTVGADAGHGGVPPVALGEQAQDRIVVAGVEVLQSGFGVIALADIALGFRL